MRANMTDARVTGWSRLVAVAAVLGTASGAFAQVAEPAKSAAPVGAALSAAATNLPSTPQAEPKSALPPVPPTATECSAALAKSQIFGANEQLIEAREQSRICANPACPPSVLAECVQSGSELEQAIPSVSFEVRADGKQVTSAEVFADGHPVTDWTKGAAMRMNPGEHHFHFDLPGHVPVNRTVKLAEGERYKTISADFVPVPAPAPVGAVAPAAPRVVEVHYERPIPFLVYPLLGIGAVGALAFTSLGVLGQLEQGNLEKGCAPRCTDDDKSSMRKLYFAADISLGIGTAALLGAGILYLGRPEQASGPTVGATILTGGGVATLTLRQF